LVFEKEMDEMAKGNRHAAAFKAKVALEALKAGQTVAELERGSRFIRR
jgi:transposase